MGMVTVLLQRTRSSFLVKPRVSAKSRLSTAQRSRVLATKMAGTVAERRRVVSKLGMVVLARVCQLMEGMLALCIFGSALVLLDILNLCFFTCNHGRPESRCRSIAASGREFGGCDPWR